MSTLIINATNPKDLNLLVEIAKRLKLSVKLVKEEKNRYNDETEKAIEEARADKNMIRAKNVDELFEKLKS